jgi:hypothetical protein
MDSAKLELVHSILADWERGGGQRDAVHIGAGRVTRLVASPNRDRALADLGLAE